MEPDPMKINAANTPRLIEMSLLELGYDDPQANVERCEQAADECYDPDNLGQWQVCIRLKCYWQGVAFGMTLGRSQR